MDKMLPFLDLTPKQAEKILVWFFTASIILGIGIGYFRDDTVSNDYLEQTPSLHKKEGLKNYLQGSWEMKSRQIRKNTTNIIPMTTHHKDITHIYTINDDKLFSFGIENFGQENYEKRYELGFLVRYYDGLKARMGDWDDSFDHDRAMFWFIEPLSLDEMKVKQVMDISKIGMIEELYVFSKM
mgnify:FL=1